MNSRSLTKEIDWFCYHLVNAGLLSRDLCIQVIEAIEEAGETPDLALFIQTLLENDLVTQAQIGKFRMMSQEEAKIFGFPQRSVFDANYVPPQTISTPAPTAAAPRTVAEAPAPLTPTGGQQPPAPRQSPVPAKPADGLPGLAPLSGRASSESLGGQAHFESHKGRSTGTTAWLAGWPDLSQAATLDTDGIKRLLDDFLHHARKAGCSDVHITAGAYPFIRRHKKIYLVPGQLEISPEVSEKLNLAPLSSAHLGQFKETHDLDYCYEISDTDRYRANVMRQRLGVAGSYRIIDAKIPSIADLGFHDPIVIEKLTSYNQGLILVTGPAGCGKTTTLNAMVNFINNTRYDHIVTIEDPIEVVHKPIRCNVTQRELHRHTKSFANALRAVLREDPDVIVIGELRDLETIEMAIHAAETGHLVFGTLHTSSAPSTMDRVLDVFPPNQQSQIRSMVAESLKGVICQQLLPNADESGLVMAAEILLSTLAVSNLIREGKTYQIDSTLQTNRNMGMSTMEQSYVDLYMDGKRTFAQTLPLVKNQGLIRQMQAQEAKKFLQGK